MAITAYNVVKEYKKRGTVNEIKEYNNIFNNIEYIEDTLNNFILARFEDYRIKNPDKFDVDFITDSSQKDITKEVLKSVFDTMSPAFKKHLCTIYNIEMLDQIIADKVIMAVMSYTIENNNNNLSTGRTESLDV